ncbi:hypothetical protein FACS189481_2810 [Clostridia bacterium]|nr:hypothetical protein FACS189481_2810 [Clostridia bacterium]
MRDMTLQQEIHALIDVIPEGKLVALLPLLSTLAGDVFAIETDLTAEEKKEIAECEAEYKVAPETFMPLCEVL